MAKFHSDFLESLSVKITDATSGSAGFAVALGIVLVWLLMGPILHFSTVWQLFINTITTTVTFLMVFLLNRAEKKDSQALHLKINQLIERLDADQSLLDLETAREMKLDRMEQRDRQKAERVRKSRRRNKPAKP
jgi:low affinity Fe/Cu permease